MTAEGNTIALALLKEVITLIMGAKTPNEF